MTKSFSFFGRSSSLLMLIFYKLLLAVIEVLAGSVCLIAAFFAKHLALVDVIKKTATADDLDRAVSWLVQQLIVFKADYQIIQHVGIILIAFGLFNVLLAVGVWFKSHKMRQIALVVFGGLSLYGAYEIYLDFSTLNLISLILDLIIFYYFWRVLPRHLTD
jgi:uncharacterized membrane protein